VDHSPVVFPKTHPTPAQEEGQIGDEGIIPKISNGYFLDYLKYDLTACPLKWGKITIVTFTI